MTVLHQTCFELSGPSWGQRIVMSLFKPVPTQTHYWSELHNDSTGAKELSFFKSTVSFNDYFMRADSILSNTKAQLKPIPVLSLLMARILVARQPW